MLLPLYVGVPVVLTALIIGLLYSGVGELTISPAIVLTVIIPLILVVLSPLALFSVFLLCSVTVTQRTTSIDRMVPEKEVKEGTVPSIDIVD